MLVNQTLFIGTDSCGGGWVTVLQLPNQVTMILSSLDRSLPDAVKHRCVSHSACCCIQLLAVPLLHKSGEASAPPQGPPRPPPGPPQGPDPMRNPNVVVVVFIYHQSSAVQTEPY